LILKNKEIFPKEFLILSEAKSIFFIFTI